MVERSDETDTNEPAGRPWFKGFLIVTGVVAFMAVLVAGIGMMTPQPRILKEWFPGIAGLWQDDFKGYRVVAVYAEDREEQSFINGARMGVDEINASKEQVLGEELVLQLAMERGVTTKTALETVVQTTMSLSDRIARKKDLIGVIGHEWSDTAITASSIYSRNEILYLATHATATSLTNHGFETVFALQPNNATNADVIASYALSNGLERILVFSDKSDYGKECANFFTEAMTNAGANIVYRGFLSGTQRSTDELLMFVLDNELFKRTDFDAIFIVSSSVDETANFIKRARFLGLDLPILGMEYIFSATIERKVGKEDMKDTIGVSLYDRDSLSKTGQTFIEEYQTRYGHLPDLNAALGYDAVTLLRNAVKRADTLDAQKISDTLKVARYKEQFVGVTGPLVFDRKGAITDTQVFVVRHNGEEFHTVAKFQVPLNIRNSDTGTGDATDTQSGEDDGKPASSAKETKRQ